jgi:hypothetical protein
MLPQHKSYAPAESCRRKEKDIPPTSADRLRRNETTQLGITQAQRKSDGRHPCAYRFQASLQLT